MSTRDMSSILCIDGVRYPLKQQTLSSKALKLALIKFIGSKQTMTDYEILQKFHTKCQLLLHTPSHELTKRQVRQLDEMEQIIDIGDHWLHNPYIDHQIGRFVSSTKKWTRIHWFGDEKETKYYTWGFPANIVFAVPGDTIHAQYRKLSDGRTEWFSIKISEPLLNRTE